MPIPILFITKYYFYNNGFQYEYEYVTRMSVWVYVHRNGISF